MATVQTPQQSDALTGLTMRFATHVANLTYDQIPDEVRTKAKLILRDGIGNEIAASAISEPASRVVELIKEWGGAPQSTIIGHGIKVPAPHAALVNAMMGHGIELDDAHGIGLIKAGSVLVPAAFAVAELSGASGQDVLTGLVAGYDLAIRIAKAINPGHRQRGFHTTGTVSGIGAAALAAKLLGCDADGDRLRDRARLHAVGRDPVLSRRPLHGEAVQSRQSRVQRRDGRHHGAPRLHRPAQGAGVPRGLSQCLHRPRPHRGT